MPERVNYWGIPHEWFGVELAPEVIVYTVMFLAGFIMLFRFYRQASLWWKVGRAEARWDKLHLRIWNLIKYAIVQTKVLNQRFPGVMHVTIAWAYFIFFLGTALATVDDHWFKFLEGNVLVAYKLVLDIFTVIFFIGAGMAIYRRYYQKPKKLTLDPGFTRTLVMITVIVIGGLLTESFRLAVDKPAWSWASPAGWVVAQMWIATGASDATLINWHLGTWIFHLVTVAGTIISLPVGTLLHGLTGPLNMFFAKLDRPVGELAPIAVTADGNQIYASKLSDLSWKQLLDGDACTECVPRLCGWHTSQPQGVDPGHSRRAPLRRSPINGRQWHCSRFGRRENQRRSSVVMHDLWRLCGRLPGADRTCRHHRRHAQTSRHRRRSRRRTANCPL